MANRGERPGSPGASLWVLILYVALAFLLLNGLMFYAVLRLITSPSPT